MTLSRSRYGSSPYLNQATLIKVGGSLLNWPEWPEKLLEYLESVKNPILLFGGGKSVDVIREWSDSFPLTEEDAHLLALRAMDLTAQFAQTLLDCAATTYQPGELYDRSLTYLIYPTGYIQALEENPLVPLPHSWEATSDSIALWICGELRIPNLCLIKSIDLPQPMDLDEAAREGWIDSAFPQLWKQYTDQDRMVSVRSHNLRG